MRSSPRLSLLLVAALAAGCSSAEDATVDQAADSAAVADSAGASEGIAYTGSFQGPLGLQLWSVRERMEQDVPGTLAWVRQQGFTEVELAGTQGMTPQQFRQELDRAGLRATAMHVGYERMRDSLDAALAEAETLGARNIGVAWIPHEGSYTPEMARATAADFDRWGQAARERGLRFFYHTHGYEFEPAADGTIPFDVLVQETDPENVTFEMDVFWIAHPGQDPAALLRKHPDRWKLMHIKDMAQGTVGDFSGGASPEANVPVGTGQIDYRAVLAAADEVGVEQYYIEDESTDPVANIPRSIEYLKTVTY
ncbi:MAG TPA: sugar phosphate isomerase/epimerase [Longimicrobiaceae bacterium]